MTVALAWHWLRCGIDHQINPDVQAESRTGEPGWLAVWIHTGGIAPSVGWCAQLERFQRGSEGSTDFVGFEQSLHQPAGSFTSPGGRGRRQSVLPAQRRRVAMRRGSPERTRWAFVKRRKVL